MYLKAKEKPKSEEIHAPLPKIPLELVWANKNTI